MTQPSFDVEAIRKRCDAAYREDSIAGLEMHYEWMRDTLPALLAEVERLTRERDEARRERDHFSSDSLFRRTHAAEQRLAALELSADERETLAFLRKVVDASVSLFDNRITDPRVEFHIRHCDAAIVLLTKLLSTEGAGR